MFTTEVSHASPPFKEVQRNVANCEVLEAAQSWLMRVETKENFGEVI
jgi:hypothetical protein